MLISITNVWQVNAQGTDDSGGVILSPPGQGESAVVDETFNVINVNPTNGEPFVQIGADVAETIKDNGRFVQKAAFAFGIAHGRVAFSGRVSDISGFTNQQWVRNGVDLNDIVIRCLTADGEWTAQEVAPVITVFAIGTNYSYNITADITQHGVCALFFSSESAPNPGAGVSRADNRVGQRNRDVNVGGIR